MRASRREDRRNRLLRLLHSRSRKWPYSPEPEAQGHEIPLLPSVSSAPTQTRQPGTVAAAFQAHLQNGTQGGRRLCQGFPCAPAVFQLRARASPPSLTGVSASKFRVTVQLHCICNELPKLST